MGISKLFTFLFDKLLSDTTRHRSERVIIWIAIVSFILHVSVIFLIDFGWIDIPNVSRLLTNPIAAIYTPFSFILFYEVYLLIFYLPQSTTSYIGKQFEIIMLIVIRRIFKDLANLELTPDWFQQKYDLQFTYDIIATIILFFLIYVFYWLNRNRPIKREDVPMSEELKNFIKIKKGISVILVPVFLVMAAYSFYNWVHDNFISLNQLVDSFSDINTIFFDEFFTVLILTDVLLLLFSFNHTDKFSKVIRNSGFVISTILVKLSFSTEGLLNTTLIIVAALFGVIMLYIHNLYEDKLNS